MGFTIMKKMFSNYFFRKKENGVMNKNIKENVYEVSFRGQKVVVDYQFLYDKH